MDKITILPIRNAYVWNTVRTLIFTSIIAISRPKKLCTQPKVLKNAKKTSRKFAGLICKIKSLQTQFEFVAFVQKKYVVVTLQEIWDLNNPQNDAKHSMNQVKTQSKIEKKIHFELIFFFYQYVKQGTLRRMFQKIRLIVNLFKSQWKWMEKLYLILKG